MSELTELQKQLEDAKRELREQIANADFQRVGELQYGIIPKLQEQIEKLKK